MNMGPERCPGFWIGGNLVIPTFFLYGPLWTLILRTEESWVLGVMDIGSGLSGLLGLVWTEIGCLDGQKLGPGLGSWVFRRTEIGSGSWVSGQLFTAIPSGVWMSLRSTLPCSKHCPGNV